MKKHGFTLVELMVVVIVIAILAGIVIVSYSNWRTQTAQTAVESDLVAASTAMKNAATWGNSGYPPTIPTSFSPSPNATVTVVSSTATSFCLKGVSQSVASVVYYISDSNSSPHSGGC